MKNDTDDSLFVKSQTYFMDKEFATTGMLIRQFKIGFNRASALMNDLEKAGVVGPEESGGKHRVLIPESNPNLPFYNESLGSLVKNSFIEAIIFIAKSIFPIFTIAFCIFVIIISINDYKNIIIDKSFFYFVSAFFKQILKCIIVGDIIYYIWKFKHSNSKNKNYDKMEGHEFEHYCAKLLKLNGFKNVEVTRGSGDHGIDILAQKDKKTYAIQCKCYSSNVGNSAVQEAYAGKTIYGQDIAVVLTNRYFTTQAKEEAKILGVELWDRDYLNKLKN